MRIIDERAVLTNEKIDACTDAVQTAYVQAAKKRAIGTTRLDLLVDETLLRFRDSYGADVPVRLVLNKHLENHP